MFIGTDLDDVLTDFVGGFAEYHNKKYGTNLKRSDFHTYNFSEVLGGSSEEITREFHEFYKSNEFKGLKPFEDAVKYIDLLSKRHKIIIITSRPKEIELETVEWVKKYFPGKISNIYFSRNHSDPTGKEKLEICEEAHIDVLIDDCLEHLTKFKNHTKLLLYDAPWNRNKSTPSWVERVKSWEEIYERVDEYEKSVL